MKNVGDGDGDGDGDGERTLPSSSSSSYTARSIILIFSNSESGANLTFFLGLPVFALIPGVVLAVIVLAFDIGLGLGGGTAGEPFRIDLSASANGFQSAGGADADSSDLTDVESPAVELELELVVDAVGIFFLKLGSLALGFDEKKLESDWAPFTTVLPVEAETDPVVAPAEVAVVVAVVGADERLPSAEGSFLTTALAPEGVDMIAFFAGGIEDVADNGLVLEGLDSLEDGAGAESGCFRFLVFVSVQKLGCQHWN